MIKKYLNRMYICIAGFIFFMYSCNSRTTSEQRQKYDQCKKSLLENEGLFDLLINGNNASIPGWNVTLSDSVKQILNEVKDLSLEEIANKYNMSSSDIDAFILAICISDQINNTYKKFNADIEKLNEELIETLGDTALIDVNKIKPMPFDTVGYSNRGEPK